MTLTDPCHIPDPTAPLVLISLLCPKQWHRSSASITSAQPSSSRASEGEHPQGHPPHLPAPTFGVQPGPVPCTAASPCSRPPGSLLLLGCWGWDAIHTHPRNAALQKEERSARPCWDHPAQEMFPGELGQAGTPCAPHSQEWNLFPWSWRTHSTSCLSVRGRCLGRVCSVWSTEPLAWLSLLEWSQLTELRQEGAAVPGDSHVCPCSQAPLQSQGPPTCPGHCLPSPPVSPRWDGMG